MEAPAEPRRLPWSLVLWTAVLLACLRGAALYGMQRLAHEADQALALLRLARALPEVAWQSGLAALLLGLALFTAGAIRGRGSRALATLFATLLAALAFTWILAGWSSADPSRGIGLQTERGRQAASLLAATGLGLAALHLVLGRRERSRGMRGAWLPALLLSSLVWPVPAWLTPGGGSMRLREIRLDLVAEGERWKVLEAREDRAPYAGVVTPSLRYADDGADLPSLVLPPPARIAFEVPAELGAVHLRTRIGVDQGALRASKDGRGARVRFEVHVEGERRFEGAVPLTFAEGAAPTSEWRDVGGEEGLVLEPGQRVELSTHLEGPGADRRAEEPLVAGFGQPTLERWWELEREPSSPTEPNVLLVVMDTQRADRMSAYGYERPTTPVLERLAARGVLYEEAHSTASWTWPSTASILTGLTPEEHGVLNHDQCYLDLSIDTLAEALQREGFTTAAWSGNPLIVPGKNFDQGFELFEHGREGTRKSDLLVPAALEWLEATAGTRFFLYLHLTEPHAPQAPLPEGRRLFAPDVPRGFSTYAINNARFALLEGCGHSEHGEVITDECVPPLDQERIHDLYDASTWSGDYWLGLVLAKLEELGLEDETIVAYTSDHGEEIFDHGLAGHGQSLYRHLVRVPLVLAGPGIPQGLRVEHAVSNRHVAPTLAGLVGATMEGSLDGLDLLDLEALSHPRPLSFSTYHGWWNGREELEVFGLRRGEHVLHLAPEAGPWGSEDPSEGGELALFDLAGDPGERRDLSEEERALAEELRALLERRRETLSATRRAPAVESGAATLKMLQDLGYVGTD